MKKILFILAIFIFSFSILALSSSNGFNSLRQLADPIPALAQVTQQITLTYPIPQLDNCRDAKECYFYCEIPRHQTACAAFSHTRNLTKVLGTSTISSAEKLYATTKRLGITYPINELGNCADHHSCKNFCNQPQNKTTCTTFARNHHL